MTNPRNEGLPTIAQLHENFSYDPETGLLRRKIMGYVRNRPVGSMARGYLTISIKNRKYFLHRVVWAMHYGEWTDLYIDHINGKPSDNRIANLRVATKMQNGQNRGKTINNTSGFKGVYKNKRTGRWFSIGKVGDKQKYLGSYGTPDEAREAYQAFIRVTAGEFARAE